MGSMDCRRSEDVYSSKIRCVREAVENAVYAIRGKEITLTAQRALETES